MLSRTPFYYDKIYSFKDYKSESEKLIQIIRHYGRPGARLLLDVACGTGRHLEFLKSAFQAEGLDIDANLLHCARVRNPQLIFHCADMTDFNLEKKFDIITCLYGSIGYVRTVDNLTRTFHAIAHHVLPGGFFILEPWFTASAWRAGQVYAQLVDEPNLKIARMSISSMLGRISAIDFHYLVGTDKAIEHITEHHELGLFEKEETTNALVQAGFTVTWLEKGLSERDLIVAKIKMDI
jgi:SAM-dependent methyltransferase